MNERIVLTITAIAAFSLTLISIFSFRKAQKNIAFLWLGFLFFSPVVSFISNLLIFLKQGSILLFHLSMLFNLSFGGFLTLTFKNLKNTPRPFFNIWFFLPSAAYLPFILYSILYPKYIIEIITSQYQNGSFIISSFYNLMIVAYSLIANILVLIQELKNSHSSSQYSVRTEILIVMLVLQTFAFVPFLFKLDISYVILYMPVFGQLFFLYLFFRLSPDKVESFINPSMKKKYSGLNTCMEKKKELESRITNLMHVKKSFSREDCSLQLIAKELNESPHTISMIVNSQFNMSFPDFINSYRVKLAIDLLQNENTTLSIEGIAFECGFGNKTSFYKAFKKETGKLPSEYLKGKEGVNL